MNLIIDGKIKKEAMMEKNTECPCCGHWAYDYFHRVPKEDYKLEAIARRSNPDTGHCRTCGFRYKEHADFGDSMKDQVERHRKSKKYKKWFKSATN